MTTDPSPDLAKTAVRLRRLRFPLAAMIIANTCWLVLAPSWKEQSGATAVAQTTQPASSPVAASASDGPSQTAVVDAGPSSTAEVIAAVELPDDVESPDKPSSAEAAELSSLAPADCDQGDANSPGGDGDADLQQLASDTASELPPKTAALKPAPATLINPQNSGGPIGFLLDGQEHWLAPGESLALPNEGPHEIVFHRGADFGEARAVVKRGEHRFRPTPAGWRLESDENHAAHPEN
jgi:hypothetical protein